MANLMMAGLMFVTKRNKRLKPSLFREASPDSTMATSMPSRLESLIKIQRAHEHDRVKASCSHSFSSTSSTKSIPIHLNQQDLQEEWEIREQEMIAEERDYYMFHRIVNGMIGRQASGMSASSDSYKSETDKSIANIMRTRYKNVDSEKTEDMELIAYDDETELAYNGRRRDMPVDPSTTNQDDRPPDTIFILDL